MKHEIAAWYQRDTHNWKPNYSRYSLCTAEHVQVYTHTVRTREDYQELEAYIQQLVAFAIEIRHNEPAWSVHE